MSNLGLLAYSQKSIKKTIMEKLDIQVETKILLAKQKLRINCCNEDITEWALQLWESGCFSENLCILAGLDSSDYWNIELYFKKVLEELNIDLNTQDILDFYFIDNINKILDNPKILTIELISMLREVVDNTSYYLNEHFRFFSLYDELDELTGIPKEEYAIREFKEFIKELE